MAPTFKVGTRTSPLALRQVEEIGKMLKQKKPGVCFQTVGIKTTGDRDKKTPLSQTEGSDFFTKEIDRALLAGEVDMAVHSAKDLPDRLPEGLEVTAITKSIDPYDVLVSKNHLKLSELSKGAKIGTSSERRKKQLKSFRSDLKIVDIRGNIEERLKKLKTSELDAIVIAAAGLKRLGLESEITERIRFDILEPHPLQGKLAVQVRRDRKDLLHFFKSIDERQK